MKNLSLDKFHSSNWKKCRLKFAAPLKTERGDRESQGLEYLGLENIESWTGKLVAYSQNDDLGDEKDTLQSGIAFNSSNVLFGKLRPYLAKIFLPKTSGVCSTEFLVLKPSQEIQREYLFYTLLDKEFITTVNNSTFGSRMPRANWDFIGSQLVAVPPIDIQKQIADYLDRETTKIDALIAEKERSIALIEEKHKSLISHAVTAGIRDAEEKQNTVKTRLKFFTTKIGSGKTPRGGSSVYVESGVIFLRSQNVHFNGLKLDDVVFISEDVDEEMKNTRVQPRDVLLNITGASLGRCAVAPQNLPLANVSQHVSIIRCKDSLLNPTYLFYTFQGAEIQNKIWGDENGSSREGLTFDRIGNFLVSVPPLECQAKIVNYLDRETEKTDDLLAAIKDSIALLKERRSALITAAVTGQIAPEMMS